MAKQTLWQAQNMGGFKGDLDAWVVELEKHLPASAPTFTPPIVTPLRVEVIAPTEERIAIPDFSPAAVLARMPMPELGPIDSTEGRWEDERTDGRFPPDPSAADDDIESWLK